MFELVNTTSAVHSSLVRRLEMVENITPVPNAPAELEGIVLSQGKIIPGCQSACTIWFSKIALRPENSTDCGGIPGTYRRSDSGFGSGV